MSLLDSFLKDIPSASENGFIPASLSGTKYENEREAFAKRAIPGWETSIKGTKELLAKLISLKDSNDLTGGDAYRLYSKVVQQLKDNGMPVSDMVDFLPSTTLAKSKIYTRTEVLGSLLVEKDGKVKPVVDKIKFTQQISSLLATVNRFELLKAVARNTAEQNFWELIMEMLVIEESFELLGVLTARMLVPLEMKKVVDQALSNVTILTNKSGKLSVGVITLGGFLGLATLKGEPALSHAMKMIRNPLLREDPMEYRCVKRTGETNENFKIRKSEGEINYNNYKAIMLGMKVHAEFYEKMDGAMKNKIKVAVLRYTVQG